ncbi:hypothetical protein LSH36_219g02010 [Paralvinella palmiformis]|uniref:Uncharacterized protein n=1 Tax=Paralvinella palmiformis TaxID=53620 RepID=A0AAD9N5H9_9ANNE|nr:hypothetical protein LSH36_219g02010 [Paralvinella palmiformis]
MLFLGIFHYDYTSTRSRNCVSHWRKEGSEYTKFVVLCHEVLPIPGPVPSIITGSSTSATPSTHEPALSPAGPLKLSLRKGFSSPCLDHITHIGRRLEFASRGKVEM